MYGIGQAAFRGVRASILGAILDTRAKTIISRIAHKETLRSFHCFIKEEPLFNLLASRKASTEKKKFVLFEIDGPCLLPVSMWSLKRSENDFNKTNQNILVSIQISKAQTS